MFFLFYSWNEIVKIVRLKKGMGLKEAGDRGGGGGCGLVDLSIFRKFLTTLSVCCTRLADSCDSIKKIKTNAL